MLFSLGPKQLETGAEEFLIPDLIGSLDNCDREEWFLHVLPLVDDLV